MASVGSVNPGVGTLLQTFSRTGSSALSSTLSSSTVQSALNNAAPVDIVQLSDQAVQLQQASSLFGDGANSATTDAGTQLLQSLDQQDAASEVATSGSGSTGTTALPSTPSPATSTAASETPSEAIASYLFGSGNTDGSITNTVSYLG